MKQLLTILLILGIAAQVHATHLIGGHMAYECLGNDEYEINLTVYRDAFFGQPGFDDPAPVAVYNASGNLIKILSLTPDITEQQYYTFNPFLIVPVPSWKVEIGEYKVTTQLPSSPGGYFIVYQRCCYASLIANLASPASQGFTLYSHITEDAMQLCNASPILEQDQPNWICVGDSFSFIPHFSDPNGDTLRYRLGPIFSGGAAGNPAPNPPAPPPYDTNTYGASYSPQMPFGPNEYFEIDSLSGLMSGHVANMGLYQVGIIIDEYRQGQLIGSHNYNFPFSVGGCIVDSTILDPLGTHQLNFAPGGGWHERGAAAFNIGFAVDSFYRLAHVSWDFGDTLTTADEFTGFSAEYTYPQEGIYQVHVIYEFDGLADTAYGTVICGDPLGWDEPGQKPVLIYPNPGKDALIIQTDIPESAEITLSDLKGATMLRTTKRHISTETLPVGKYLVTGWDEQGNRLFTVPWIKVK